MIRLDIPVRAVPQGSHKHVGGGRVVPVGGQNLKAFRSAIAAHALRAMGDRELEVGPVGVTATYYFKRPKKHHRGDGELRDDAPLMCYPAKRGDVDKLVRATLDGLTGVAFKDDAQVVTQTGTVMWGVDDRTVIVVAPVRDHEDEHDEGW